MISRRHFLLVSTLGALAPIRVFAQAKPVRVGILSPRPFAESLLTPGIVRRLAELGYRDGATMVLEYRSAEGAAERYLKQARELVDLKCDVIFAVGPEHTALALRDTRSAIPVVFLANDYDPVEKGLVTSFRRPERNMTGVYVPQNALVAKRLELLREIVPAARRVLMISDAFSRDQLAAARKIAGAEGMRLTVIEFEKQPYDYEAAFRTGAKDQVHGFVMLASPVFASGIATLGDLARRYRMPSVGMAGAAFAEVGFIADLAPNIPKITGRVAEIGARILKGAKPSEIPVDQADEFDLVVNLKAAKTLGIKLPYSVLARATRMIE